MVPDLKVSHAPHSPHFDHLVNKHLLCTRKIQVGRSSTTVNSQVTPYDLGIITTLQVWAVSVVVTMTGGRVRFSWDSTEASSQCCLHYHVFHCSAQTLVHVFSKSAGLVFRLPYWRRTNSHQPTIIFSTWIIMQCELLVNVNTLFTLWKLNQVISVASGFMQIHRYSPSPFIHLTIPLHKMWSIQNFPRVETYPPGLHS